MSWCCSGSGTLRREWRELKTRYTSPRWRRRWSSRNETLQDKVEGSAAHAPKTRSVRAVSATGEKERIWEYRRSNSANAPDALAGGDMSRMIFRCSVGRWPRSKPDNSCCIDKLSRRSLHESRNISVRRPGRRNWLHDSLMLVTDFGKAGLKKHADVVIRAEGLVEN